MFIAHCDLKVDDGNEKLSLSLAPTHSRFACHTNTHTHNLYMRTLCHDVIPIIIFLRCFENKRVFAKHDKLLFKSIVRIAL